MTYDEALKMVRDTKHKENLIIVKLGYELHMVLPYADGIALMASIKNAEQFDKTYSATRIHELDRSKIEFVPMSRQEYERYKISALLHITLEEALALQTPQPPPTQEPDNDTSF